MQNKVHQNKEFRTLRAHKFAPGVASEMHKPKSINELLKAGGKRLTELGAKTRARTMALEHVRAALPPPLAAAVVSAGIDNGRLTIGATGAPWAARLRYETETLRTRVAGSLGVDIQSVRIRVVRPLPGDEH